MGSRITAIRELERTPSCTYDQDWPEHALPLRQWQEIQALLRKFVFRLS
jgi:hypothetical protein